MASNAVTRAIIKRKPTPISAPPPLDSPPLSDEEKEVNQEIDKIHAPGEAKQKQGLAARFSGLEQKLFSQELGRGQSEQDILSRRFRRIGNVLGEKAEQKAFGLSGREAGRRLDIGQAAIEQERGTQEQALDDIFSSRRLSTGERIRGENFAEKQRIAAQDFSSEERVEAQRHADLQQAKDIKQQEDLAADANALTQQQIDVRIKELDFNVLVTLENLSKLGPIDPSILDALEAQGMDVSKWRPAPAPSSAPIVQTGPTTAEEAKYGRRQPKPKPVNNGPRQMTTQEQIARSRAGG